MWVASRADGLDDPCHTKRSPIWAASLPRGVYLRKGFCLQLVGLTGLLVSYWWHGGTGLYTYDLRNMPAAGKENGCYLSVASVFFGIYLLGALALMSFQIVAADDTCWARGYRSGSKLLRLATFLDVLASIFSFLFSLYMAKHYSNRWYVHFSQGGSEWMFFAFSRLIRMWSLAAYAASTYLLEVYHDEGAGDTHGYINAILFSVAAAFEMLSALGVSPGLAPLALLGALLAAALWAMFFEPEVNYVSPALYETELTNELEQQVDTFAKASPSYAMPLAHNSHQN